MPLVLLLAFLEEKDARRASTPPPRYDVPLGEVESDAPEGGDAAGPHGMWSIAVKVGEARWEPESTGRLRVVCERRLG